MRALWSDKQNCSHNMSQKFKRIRRVSDRHVILFDHAQDTENYISEIHSDQGQISKEIGNISEKLIWGVAEGFSIRADFEEGDATKHFSVKKGVFSEKGGGNSVNGGFGKDFYRKGNSVKRSGPFSEPPDSEK